MEFLTKNIIISIPFSKNEINAAKFGATRLIKEQIENLENRGYNVSLLAKEEENTFCGAVYGLINKARQSHFKKKASSVSDNNKWRIGLILWLIREYSSRIRGAILPESGEDKITFIQHFPFCATSLYRANSKKIKEFIIYQHNVEWVFYEDKLIPTKINKFLLRLLKSAELKNLLIADKIICVTESDKEILAAAGLSRDRLAVWVAFPQKIIKLPKINYNILQQDVTGKVVVGFVGTNFGPNIHSVNNIINVAKILQERFVFLIIGSVAEAFRDKVVPPNVIFTGFVKDIDEYLLLCSVFINPKETSDTGIEIKMFDYMKYNKPIISTRIGAHGCEAFENVHVCENVEQLSEKIKEIIKI